MKNPIRTFVANVEGRDFAIGDLHGSFSLFEKLLDYLDFDPLKDRMFSVGDLCDRGPDSQRCLELLYEPWFHAVLSNHEQMMWEAFNGGIMGQYWLQNGGAWGIEALNTWRTRNRPSADGGARLASIEEHRLFDLLDIVGELPFIMTIGRQGGGRVHIIHAELPPGHVITDDVLASPEKVLELATIQSHDGDFFAWGRHIFRGFYQADLSNLDKVRRAVFYHNLDRTFNDQLSHIVSGHTILQQPLTIIGQTNIDTGAYGSLHSDASGWEGLTCVDLNAWKFYKVRPSGVAEFEPVVVTAEDIERLRTL